MYSIAFNGLPWPVVAVAAVLCVVIIVRYAAFLRRVGFAGPHRVLLPRIAAFILLLVVASGLKIVYPGRAEVSRSIAVVLDDSQSMMFPDEEGRPRFDAARDFARRLTKAAGPDTPVFAASRPGAALKQNELDSLKPLGAETRLIDAVRAAAETDGQGPTDVVLLTDGNETAAPDASARALREAAGGLRAHSVVFGAADARNLSVERLLADEFIEAGKAAQLEAVVSAPGVAEAATLEVELDGKPVSTKRIRPGAGERIPVRVTPRGAGIHKVSVSVRAGKKEIFTPDNSRAAYIRVVGGRRKILYADIPRWEFSRLKNRLETIDDVEAEFLLITPKGNPLDRPARSVLSSAALDGYRVVVVGALGGVLTRAEESRLAGYVRGGGRLVALGGRGSVFSKKLPALAAALPAAPSGVDSVAHGAFGLRLTSAGKNHPLMRVDAAEWENLPYLSTFNRGVAKGGAETLAEHPWENCGAKRCPIIVHGRAGEGRALLLAAEGWWKWDADPEHAGAYRDFWAGAVKTLIEDDETAGPSVSLPKRNFALGERVCVSVRGAAEVEIAAPDGRTMRRLKARASRAGEGMSACFIAEETGDFIARVAGGGKRTKPEPFSVAVSPGEFIRPAANPAFAKRLAGATGGSVHSGDNPGKTIPKLLMKRSVPASKTWRAAASPPVFVLIILLLGIEWALRRREGLV